MLRHSASSFALWDGESLAMTGRETPDFTPVSAK
jgi:hypothetical protein